MKEYYIYILSNYKRNVLYVGVTNNLLRRLYEHRQGNGSSFTNKYKCYYLIFFETTTSIESAIAREKEIKKWRREKKLNLIRSINPSFNDLSKEWFN